MPSFQFEPSELEPLIRRIAAVVADELDRRRRETMDRIGYSEREAERLLDIGKGALGRARRAGEIRGSLVAGQIRYTRDDLLRFLAEHPYVPDDGACNGQDVGIPADARSQETWGEGSSLVRGLEDSGGDEASEVLRALIDRARYVGAQVPCAETELAGQLMVAALYLLESRAARRHGRVINDGVPLESIVAGAGKCLGCGHVGCIGGCGGIVGKG